MKPETILNLAVNLAAFPCMVLDKKENGQIFMKDGADTHLLKAIQRKYGFEFEISYPADGEWGRENNGTWTGLIGMINRKEVDVASACLSMTYSRIQAADFTYPYIFDREVIITKTPPIKSKAYAVIMPFTKEVWGLILFTLIVKVGILQLVLKRHTDRNRRKPPSLITTFWNMLGILLNGGVNTKAVNSPLFGLLIGLWLMFVLILQSCYSGNLMSFLSIPSREVAINSLTDLARAVVKRNMKCGCIKGTSGLETFTTLEGELSVITKAAFKDDSNFVYDEPEGLSKVLDENYAFIAPYLTTINFLQQMDLSNFHLSVETSRVNLISFAVRRNFPYKEHFNAVILRAAETGLLQKWERDQGLIDVRRSQQQSDEETAVGPLNFSELYGALMLWVYGHSFSVIVLIAEKCYGVIETRRSKKVYE